MKKIKENKGITLIALIITIIVLLILAIVAISAVQGDGIIAHAKNARDNYKDAQDTENTVLGNYMVQLNEANEQGTNLQEDGNEEEIVSGPVSLVAGSTIPSGYFYITNINEEEQDEEWVYTADCYAASETEIANNTMTFDGDQLILNYKSSIMPSGDNFADENGGYLYCMNTGFIFSYFSNGLYLDIDTSFRDTFTSISTINDMINGGISIYGYNKVKSASLYECKSIVDASTLNISGFIRMAGMFNECTSLTTAPTIPTTVTDLDDCFGKCTSLTEVTYAGTIAQFKQISKYKSCGKTGLIVHCSDEDYTVGQE